MTSVAMPHAITFRLWVARTYGGQGPGTGGQGEGRSRIVVCNSVVVSSRVFVGSHRLNPKPAYQRASPAPIPFLKLSCNYKILRTFSVLAIDNPGARGLYLERMEGN